MNEKTMKTTEEHHRTAEGHNRSTNKKSLKSIKFQLSDGDDNDDNNL